MPQSEGSIESTGRKTVARSALFLRCLLVDWEFVTLGGFRREMGKLLKITNSQVKMDLVLVSVRIQTLSALSEIVCAFLPLLAKRGPK